MVISSLSFSAAAALSAASFLTARMSRPAKEAKLPIAARNHRGPELSARAASMSPRIKSAGLDPFITTPTCLSSADVPAAMLAPGSDNKREGLRRAAGALTSGRPGHE